MDYAEAMEHGMGGGDPDYGPPEPPADFPECPECGHTVRPDQMRGSRCEDCAA